jgi:hypothetical protein
MILFNSIVEISNTFNVSYATYNPSSRSQWERACWDCGFKSRSGNGCLCVVNVMRRQVQVSETSWSLIQRSPTDCRGSLCVIQKPREWGCPVPLGALAPKTNKQMPNNHFANCLNSWFIHSVVCLTTGLKPLPKRVNYRVHLSVHKIGSVWKKGIFSCIFLWSLCVYGSRLM